MFWILKRLEPCLAVCLIFQASLMIAHASSQGSAPSQVIGDALPASADGIKVLDQVGDFLPLELQFRDDMGKSVVLRDYFRNNKVIVLTMNYSDCPGLCMAQLENLVATLRKLDCQGLGENFEMVSVSIDPREDSARALRTKKKYSDLLGNSKAESAWHFLTGKQPEITALAKSLGFYYTYDRVNDRFNHPAVTYFINSDGRICRYFLDLGIEPNQFQLAVAESAEGKLSRSLAESFVQFCYFYDPEANRYSASARRILALGGGAFALLLFGFLSPFWFSSRKKSEGSSGSQESGSEECLS